MHTDNQHPWHHDHSFGQEKKRPGEGRTIIVIGITATMMVIEIVTGLLFGSMALLADGLHMASHAAALTITAFAYLYARRHAHDQRYSFGTGKVNSLGGFTGAVLLAVFSLIMALESLGRLRNPVDIAFNDAILIAIVGLLVNGASAFILGHQHAHDDPDFSDDGVEHECEQYDASHGPHNPHHDHNLEGAYLHVLADALTSLLAIFALLAGKYFGLNWMDPLTGILGAILVAQWSIGLLCASGAVLLDRQGPEKLQNLIRESIESNNADRVTDLHLWLVGPSIFSVELAIVSDSPQSPDHYKDRLPKNMGLAHVNVEVHRYVPADNPAKSVTSPP